MRKLTGCMNAKITPCIASLVIILLCTACGSDRDAPDVSHLDGSFGFVRTEQVLFALDSNATAEQVREAFSAHQEFWELFFLHILPDEKNTEQNAEQDTGTFDPAHSHWRDLVTNPYLRAIKDSIDADYGHMDDLQVELSTAFRYLQYYFPGNKPPNVYTLISGFGFFPFIFEDGERDGIGISLDMFLGADFPYREFVGNNTAFSDYRVRTFTRDHITKRTLEVIVDDLTGAPSGNRLIDLMIHNGKKLYAIEHLLPGMADSVLFEFTPAQVAWCVAHERDLWAHFLTEDLLYSNEFGKIQKLVNPAPNVVSMPPEAPGGVANWTGWRIIHAFAARHPDLKLIDIVAQRDAQAIVELSRYRPR